MRIEALIVGQGLAGTALAWDLRRRGISFLIVDPAVTTGCSRAAAGILTPLAGQRLAPSWRLDEALPLARQTYDEVAQVTGQQHFTALPVLRWLLNPLEKERWGVRRQDPAVTPYLLEDPAGAESWMQVPPYGAVLLGGGGYLDTVAYLEASQAIFLKEAAWQQGVVDPRDLHWEQSRVRWREVEARFVLFAQGWKGASNPLFDWVPFNSAKGEILDLESQSIGDRSILSAGKWVLPLGHGRFRAGSTYTHGLLDELPSEEGKTEILDHLSSMVRDKPTVVNHRAGIRPVIRGQQAVIGRHPGRPQVAFFNGLRSKGVLLAPLLAKLLVDHLWEGAPLPREVDLASNF